MNNWKINKTVDLARGIDGVEVWPHALLVTGDKNAHEWNVTVIDNGKAASLDGIIQAYFVRSDGATVTATGSVAGNVATVTMPEACYAYEGDLSAVMQLIQDDVSVTLSALLLRVRQISTDVIIDPGEEIPSLDDLLAQIEKMKQATSDANAATNKANQAATNAETRVDDAISAAEGRIDTAVQSAETATSKANASSVAADASKEAADTAAEAANEAADRANKAASGVGIRKQIVEQLPDKAEMEQDVLYLVRRAEPNAENVYDEYMLINGEVEAIGSTKTDLEGYATKEYVGEQIDDIEIGGRNYLTETSEEWKQFTGFWHYQVSDIFPVGENEDIKPGDKFTIQGEIDNKSDNSNEGGLWVGFPDAHDPNIYLAVDAGKKEKIVHTFTIPEDANSLSVEVYFGKNAVGNLWYRKLKLERGNKATDWSPAPDDIATKEYVGEAVDAIQTNGINLFSVKNSVYGYLEDGGIGNITPTHQAGEKTSDYIPVSPGEEFVFQTWATSPPLDDLHYMIDWMWFSDRAPDSNVGEKKRVPEQLPAGHPGMNHAIAYSGPAPENAKYLRVSARLFYDGRIKVERGRRPTVWTPAPEDTDYAISRRTAVTYDYHDAHNLKNEFMVPDKLREELEAENYSRISVGDYWPVTLNGTFWDWGAYTAPTGALAFSSIEDMGNDGNGVECITNYEGTYVDDNVVLIHSDDQGGIMYVKSSECLPYFERSCTNVTVKLEIAGINHYWRYGESGELAGNKPHIVFISRDCLPFGMRMRKGLTKWEDATTINPWVGSAMYKTLNDPEHGLIRLLMQTELGPHIHSGPNDKGMRALMENKGFDAVNAIGWDWYDRGKLFLPSSTEVFGHPFWAETNWDSGLWNQFPIFRDSRRHFSKGFGDGGERTFWWLGSSGAGANAQFVLASATGNASSNAATDANAVPVCFIFV